MSNNASKKSRLSAESPTLPLPPPAEPGRDALGRLLGALDADEIRMLAERLKVDPSLLNGSVQTHSATGAKGEPPSHIVPITREDIARNNLSLEGASSESA